MTVKEIVVEYLEKNGYDGLCGKDCGCEKDNLLPCGRADKNCGPAKKAMCPNCLTWGYYSKEALTEKLQCVNCLMTAKAKAKAKAKAWDKLITFLEDDTDLTTDQIRANLTAQGVDVEVFLKRIHKTVRAGSEYKEIWNRRIFINPDIHEKEEKTCNRSN